MNTTTPATETTSQPSTSLLPWEALGEEHWTLKGGTPSPLFEQLRKAYVAAHSEVDAARGEAQRAKASQEFQKAEKEFSDLLVSLWHKEERNALCFSGGGIRSASFGLGVVQALAQYSWNEPQPGEKEKAPTLLSEFHYLSTVSGGGYLGGWLSSWIARAGGIGNVIKQLASAPNKKLDPQPDPVFYLRNFTNYLNPRLGLLSADTWTLAATVVRNIILNWLVLIPLLAAVLVLPRLFYALLRGGPSWHVSTGLLEALIIAAGVFGAVATAYIVYDLPQAINARQGQSSFLRFCLFPLILTAVFLCLYWAWHIETGGKLFPSQYSAWLATSSIGGGLAMGLVIALLRKVRLRWGWMLLAAVITLVTGAVGAVAGYRIATLFVDTRTHSIFDLRVYAWLGVPAVLVFISIMQLLMVALASKITQDDDREWWARSMAWLWLTVVMWIVAVGIVLYATDALSHLAMAISGGLTTVLGGIASRLGFSPKTSSGRGTDTEKTSPKLSVPKLSSDTKLKIILPVLLVLLVVSLASVDEVLGHFLAHVRWLSFWPGVVDATEPTVGNESLVFVLLSVPSLLAAVFVNANKFSLHEMYRTRLIRAFLGASNEHRRENRFTGFDPNDNISMWRLHPGTPLHVVNMALNLVHGDRLAWQQRKAESFTATRLHSGSCRVGYQRSKHYGRREGISLGGAITISGAAASPNMGYHSSPLVTIIMTLFNARLGAWLANPGSPGKGLWPKEGPTYAVRPFVDEAFGRTTDTNAWVYLSDGGHFENLALYEMVLRRCHNIVVIDASQDPGFQYEDLGNAIRKIRIDLGVPIEFKPQKPIPTTKGGEGPHWAVGEIQYSFVEGPGTDGVLLYVKPCLNGSEPKDVLAYSKAQPDFPHQSTADQWFDEPQFESYRRLGYHSIDELMGFSGKASTLSQLLHNACVANGLARTLGVEDEGAGVIPGAA